MSYGCRWKLRCGRNDGFLRGRAYAIALWRGLLGRTGCLGDLLGRHEAPLGSCWAVLGLPWGPPG
eukprot:1767006-Pyramimonas_sp.AAC.1